jgi:hypothetical protein
MNTLTALLDMDGEQVLYSSVPEKWQIVSLGDLDARNPWPR